MLEAGTSSAPVTPEPVERLVTEVSRLVLKRASEDRLLQPALPASLNRCLEVVRAPDYDMGEVVHLVEREPLLAAAVLRRANSAALSPRNSVSSIRAAVSRLGTREVAHVVHEVAAERIFVSRDLRIVGAASKVWQHSVAVALASRDLRAAMGQADGDEAYLTGLLHDVGKPIVVGILLEAERQIVELRNHKWIDASQWVTVLKRTHREAALAVAEKWAMPESVLAAIRDSADFNPVDRNALGNTVCFANALAKLGGLGTQVDNLDDARALMMIGRSMLGLEEDLVERLEHGLAPRVGDLNFR